LETLSAPDEDLKILQHAYESYLPHTLNVFLINNRIKTAFIPKHKF